MWKKTKSSSLFVLMLIVSYLLDLSTTGVASLNCWKCFGDSCHNLEQENAAAKVTCSLGQSCLKVYYTMAEVNGTRRYESIVRSCSSTVCKDTPNGEFHTCLRNSKQYNVLGCSLRKCCDDQNLCNSACAFSVFLISFYLLVVRIHVLFFF